MTLAMFMLMYIAIAAVFASATAIRERIHLQNAVDAAAYSGAVEQADTLSRVATINRAMAWTYVQMTRRQMDYVVMKLLDRTYAHYKSDEARAVQWNHSAHPCSGHRSSCGGWFIGANGSFSSAGQVQINGLNLTLASALGTIPIGHLLNLGARHNVDAEVLPAILAAGANATYWNYRSGDSAGLAGSAYLLTHPTANILAETKWSPRAAADFDSWQGDCETWNSLQQVQRECLNGNFDNYNTVQAGLFLNQLRAQILSDRLSIAAMNLYSRKLVREMPGRIETAAHEVLLANVPAIMQGSCRFMVSQNAYPLQDETVYDPTVEGVASKGYFCNLYNNPRDEARFLSFAGYDEPLIDVFKKGSTVLSAMTAGGLDQWFVRGNGRARTEGGRGIQRCYLHWPDGILKDKHPSHNPYLVSCWNTEKLHRSPASCALYTEWQWWSDKWYCIKLLFRRIHIPLTSCSGCGFSAGPGDDLFASVKAPIEAIPYVPAVIRALGKAVRGVHDDEDGLSTVSVPIGSSGFDFNARAERCPMESYQDGCLRALALVGDGGRTPLVPNTMYSRLYADDPHLYNQCYVGERAKPLILRPSYFSGRGTISVGLARKNENVWRRILGRIEGFFAAFNPPVEWTWTFASAKAGYKDPDLPLDGQYHVDWSDLHPDCGSGGTYWNLCQEDWDAVFVPVVRADSFARNSSWKDSENENLLVDWLSREWAPLGRSAPAQSQWLSVRAPPLMLTVGGSRGTLDWKEVRHALYH